MEKKKLKRTVSGILVSSVLAVTVLTPAAGADSGRELLDNFELGEAKSFSDVLPTDWCYLYVTDASALGIIQGNPDGTFNPEGELSVAESLTLASRVNAIFYNRTEELNKGSETNAHWAGGILNYAEKNGIVAQGYTGNLDDVCTRGQMADMFAKSVPAEKLAELNSMDLAPSQITSESIAVLFKAGIMIGDAEGFREDDYVTRGEAAAIINRIVIPVSRVSITEKNVKHDTIALDDTAATDTELFHLLVVQPSVMTNTHEIWDSAVTVKGPNGEDTVKLSKDNMTDSDRWLLKFNIGKFAAGDEITVTYTGDPTISYVDNDNNEDLTSFKITETDMGYLGDNNEWLEDIQLMGTEQSPKCVWILKDFNDEARISFVDMNGKPLTNVKITLVSFSGMMQRDYTTDAEGNIYVKANEFDKAAKVYFADNKYAFYKGKNADGTIESDGYGVISPLEIGTRRQFTACEK